MKTPQRIEYDSTHDGQSDWALMLREGEPHTWAVVLHGHGSSGDQLFTRADLRDVWLPALQSAKLGVLCPNLRGNAWMSPAATADLRMLIAMLRRDHGAQRVLLIGGSMGGSGTVAFAAQHPQDIDGAVALCPATDLCAYWQWLQQNIAAKPSLEPIAEAIAEHYQTTPDEQPALFAQRSGVLRHAQITMPLYIAHGDADATIPVSEARALARVMQGCENFQYVEQPGGDHDAPLVLMPEGLGWVMERVGQTTR